MCSPGTRPWPSNRLLSPAPTRTSNLKFLDLNRAPYVLYGVKYIDLVSLCPISRCYRCETRDAPFVSNNSTKPTAPSLATTVGPVQMTDTGGCPDNAIDHFGAVVNGKPDKVGRYIIGDRVAVVSSSACAELCLAETVKQCLAFTYRAASGDCELLDTDAVSGDLYPTKWVIHKLVVVCTPPALLEVRNIAAVHFTKQTSIPVGVFVQLGENKVPTDYQIMATVTLSTKIQLVTKVFEYAYGHQNLTVTHL